MGDTEGSELAILSTTDFEKVEVGVMTVEHNGEERLKAKIRTALANRGLKVIHEGSQDDLFGNPKYFAKRKMPFPQYRGPASPAGRATARQERPKSQPGRFH